MLQSRTSAHEITINVFGTLESRPDTQPTPVADGWAGADMRVFPLFNSC